MARAICSSQVSSCIPRIMKEHYLKWPSLLHTQRLLATLQSDEVTNNPFHTIQDRCCLLSNLLMYLAQFKCVIPGPPYPAKGVAIL